MNPIDRFLVLWLNHFAGWSSTFNGVVNDLSDNYLIQAAVPVTVLYYFWFRRAAASVVRRDRELIIATQLAAIVGLALARGLALALPFRNRPLVAPGLGYNVLNRQWNADIHQWSSFPSDHAVLFFALATGIALLDRWTGLAMLVYAAIIACLPRVYLGLHYPSDLLAGAVLGSAGVLVAARPRVRQPIAEPILRGVERWPGIAYAAMFLCSFQLATMFDSAIRVAQVCIRVVLAAVRHTPLLRLRIPPSAIERLAEIIVSALLLIAVSIVIKHRSPSGRADGRGPSATDAGSRARAVGAPTVNTVGAPLADAVPIAMVNEAAGRNRDQWLSPDLLEFTHDAIIIWEMDGAGILYWNSAAEQLYGYPRREAQGKVTHELLRTRLAAGGSGPELEARLAKYGVWVGELHHRTRDGRIIKIDARLALMSQHSGRWLVLEVNRDITELRAAEALREEAFARLSALRNGTPAGVGPSAG